jgi:hypothetical protein
MNQRKTKTNQLRGLASPKELLHLMSAIPRWLEDQENGLIDGLTDVFTGSCMGCGEI